MPNEQTAPHIERSVLAWSAHAIRVRRPSVCTGDTLVAGAVPYSSSLAGRDLSIMCVLKQEPRR